MSHSAATGERADGGPHGPGALASPSWPTVMAHHEWTNPAPLLVLVVPCFDEEQVLPQTMRCLGEQLDALVGKDLVRPDSFALYVDDGSRDSTWTVIAAVQRSSQAVAGVKLAHNAGHQKALLAGIQAALPAADCIISIDADLQDDVAVIADLVTKYREGFDVVYGVRRRRTTDSWFKRTTARSFYRILRAVKVELIADHADFRLMSRRALEQLERFEEVNLFLRGIVPLLGFRSTRVYYDRQARVAGVSKYPLRKMLAFGADGITSFSLVPLRMVAALGVVLSAASILGGVAALVCWGLGLSVPLWTAVLVSVWFLGGLQVTAVGVVGEYVGKTHQEVKHRPRFIVETVLEPRNGSLAQVPRAHMSRASVGRGSRLVKAQ
jgi:glycosyltransferase involved in cell wall biosynthesis